jgi:hypothetical protein
MLVFNASSQAAGTGSAAYYFPPEQLPAYARSAAAALGLPAAAVRRVARALRLHPLPGAGEELLGLAEFAGEPLAVLDLARLLGVKPQSVYGWLDAPALPPLRARQAAQGDRHLIPQPAIVQAGLRFLVRQRRPRPDDGLGEEGLLPRLPALVHAPDAGEGEAVDAGFQRANLFRQRLRQHVDAPVDEVS